MTGNWVMTDSDIRALLGLFERCQPAADSDIFYADVLTGLRELIPCDDITFQLMDVAERRFSLLFVTEEGVLREDSVGVNDEHDQLFWQEFWEEDGSMPPSGVIGKCGVLGPGQARRRPNPTACRRWLSDQRNRWD